MFVVCKHIVAEFVHQLIEAKIYLEKKSLVYVIHIMDETNQDRTQFNYSFNNMYKLNAKPVWLWSPSYFLHEQTYKINVYLI